MRRRVTLEQPLDASDGAGGATRTYAPLANLWARVTPRRAAAQFQAERQEQAITHDVRIRRRAGVTSQMRFVFAGRALLIQSVYDEDERRRFLVCQCEEVAL
jgi:SPP1 family predicted phage head-tail adaptor